MDPLSRRVWVTRSRPGAERTAERLRAAGFAPVIDPVLEIRDLGEGTIDLAGVGALAFTSVNGLAAFARRSAERALAVYAVGEATAYAARIAGFTAVRAADGDVAALAAFIAEHPGREAPVLHLSAAEPAGDLVGDLRRRGIEARALPIYEARERTPTSAIAAGLNRLEAVLLHSPRAARAIAGLLAAAAARPPILCLSEAVAKAFAAALPGARAADEFAIAAAKSPIDEALLALLPRLSPAP